MSGRRRRCVAPCRRIAAALVGPVLLGAVSGAVAAAPGDTLLASRATGPDGVKANAASVGLLSADGRHVAFGSLATNLDPADPDRTSDVFVRDIDGRTTTLVSRADGAAGPKSNGESRISAVSADGSHVAFVSTASNLDPADGDSIPGVYLRDVAEAETALVSRAQGASGANANADSMHARVSGDGRWVAFDSRASNLDPADRDTNEDVFLRDLQTEQTKLVTPGEEGAELAALSADGRHLAVIAGDFGQPDGETLGVLYVIDLVTGQRTLASRADGRDGPEANGLTSRAGVSLSADGRYVTFSSRAFNLDPADRHFDEDIYVRDMQEGETTLVTRADGRRGLKANAASPSGASLSANGRVVAFASFAWNLDPVDTPLGNDIDVFVRDLSRGRTTLASRTGSGAQADRRSTSPSLSADARYLAFASSAQSLHPGRRDGFDDVFVRDLRARMPPPGRRPRSRIEGVRRVRLGYLIVGHARDDHDVQRVELSLTRRVRVAGARVCQASDGEFWYRSARAGHRCRPRFLLRSSSTKRWHRQLGSDLAAGSYTLASRATDTTGLRERRFSVQRGNVRVFVAREVE